MSLESCSSCGYAVAILDGGCRHCNPSATDSATHSARNYKLIVTLAPVALLVGFFLYRIFVH